MDCYKLKLKNLLHTSRYCGICLENEDNAYVHISQYLEIIVNQKPRTKSLGDIFDTVFTEGGNILAHAQICNRCLKKLIQTYIFIENARETFKLINNYVNVILTRSDYIINHLTDKNIESSNVVIVLETSMHDSSDIEKQNHDVPKETAEITNEIVEVKNKMVTKKKRTYFKCEYCNMTLHLNKELKLHRLECERNQLPQCNVCAKVFENKQYLTAHYKVHSKVKCKLCNEIILEDEFLEHLNEYHEDSLHRCCTCNEIFYSLKSLQTHERICHPTTSKTPKCLMCLKNFTKDELKSHNCKFKCPECSEVPCIHYKYLLSYREQKLNKVTKAKCLDCDYVSRKKDLLLGHINREHLDYHPYSCDKCGEQFYSKGVLKAHIRKFHEDFFICQYCDSEFGNLNKYYDHVKDCEDIKRSFKCDDCPASFDTNDELVKHKKHRHSEEVFPCGLCNKKFLEDWKRKEHMAKVHSGLQIKNQPMNVECVVCQVKFDTKGELVKHMKSHGPSTTYPCRICNTEYETLRQFRAHYRKHNGPFATCDVCGKEMREVLLKKHMTTHSNGIETCETCGRSFQNIALLKYHQKIHLENVPCPKCKKLINPARLRRHWKGHLIKENPALRGAKKQQANLKCKECDYKTWNNTLLECHMNRHHLKIKPYVCHICSKDFIGKHLLKKHIETHDMKSVSCMVCLKSFANPACLKMHLRLHTGEKPFTCEICGDRFRSSSIMNVHKLKKHSDRRNTCPLCSNKFYTVRDLRRHVIKVHWKHKHKRFDPRDLKELDKEHYHLFHDGRRVKVAEEDVDFYMPC